MAAVSTALVSSSGRLLIELDDGSIIDAGYVRGGQGGQGERGQEGPRGANGVDGKDGINGAQWHTGVGMPELSLGANGDLYMDVANSLLPIYQKVGNNWLLLCNLKIPPSGGGGGAGGAAGGGGSIIIYPKPDGGAPPTNDNDGKPIDKGDIWLDTNTGWLWVYDGSVWLPVGDRPPVSISPSPPLWNSTGDTDNRYPIVEGSLWFDSDQLALYVAAKDSSNNMVWVITIPADRSVLLSEVPVNPFVFPASATGTYANDGDTVYNTTTELWYIYNGKKNQWIDLPPGRQELSLQAILLRGADNFPTTFEYEPADRITYDTDALCYVNEDDHPDFTRIVVPFVDTAGFDWTFLLRGIRKGDQLSLIQIDAVDPLNPDDDFPFRSDFLTISDITENADSINVDIEYQQENPVHLPLFGENVAIRFKAIVNVSDREVYYQGNAPDLINNPDLLEGNLWVDSDNNKMYVWDGSVWSEVTTCSGGGGDGDFVKIEGDTMTGPLEIDLSENPPVGGLAASLLLQGSRPDLTNSCATVTFQNEQSNLTGGIGYLTYRTDPSASNTSYFKFSKQLEVSRGIFQNLAVRDDATYGVRVERRFTAAEDKEGTGFALRGIRATNYDSEDGTGTLDNIFAIYHNKPEAGVSKADSIAYFGKIVTARHITTKEYVDDAIADATDGVEESIDKLEERADNSEQLQRELNNIVSEGTYLCPSFVLSNQLPAIGEYLPFENAFTSGGTPVYWEEPAEEYESIGHIRFSAIAGIHSRLDLAEVGDTLVIQHVGSDAGGKYEITKIDDFSGGPTGYFEVHVTFIEGFADGNIEKPSYDQVQVIKSGGTGEFVEIDGDIMTGALEINVAGAVADDPLFTIKGAQAPGGAGDNVLAVISKTGGDQARYYGPITFNKEVTTKEFVDNKFDFSQYPELT